MRCPKCHFHKSSVVDSRQAEAGTTIRRRRECEACHHRFTTFERVEELPLLVVKKDGTREQFSRDKILNGIVQSAQKRPVSSDDIESVISRIEQQVRGDYETEVSSSVIGNLVMDELAELDEITYVRFASVYKSFKDVDEIEDLLQQITKRVRTKKETKKESGHHDAN
ncbi:transcriptional regulator NrdR [Streptococcus sp. zg-JUN1979]|uniref:transcriptional regulator NrdR n=1 Tax=Streptococcus sp. zg-JUN1979 TaxID=3391450 RepID=UPI0039A53E28